MPTAVEHGFLKLDGFENPGEQHKLNQAFLKIDNAFIKLEGATDTEAFLELERRGAIKHEFETIGGAFIKLGDGLGDIANVALKIDDFVIKLTSAGGNTVTADGVTTGGVDPQTDFLKLDAALTTSAGDLKLFGEDFLKLDRSTSVSDFSIKLDAAGSVLGTLGSDMTANENAFDQLGQDFIKLGGGDAGAGAPIIDMFYKELGADLYKIGSDFGSLSSDFLKLESAITSGGVTVGSAVELLSASSGGGAGGPIGSAFAALDQDFLKLDHALGAAGGPAAALIGDFIHKFFGGGGAA